MSIDVIYKNILDEEIRSKILEKMKFNCEIYKKINLVLWKNKSNTGICLKFYNTTYKDGKYVLKISYIFKDEFFSPLEYCLDFCSSLDYELSSELLSFLNIID